MMSLNFAHLRKLLFLLPPEQAHHLSLVMLKNGWFPNCSVKTKNNMLSQNLCGLDFQNPVGLSAGFDKNAEALAGLSKLGFGFVEIGTVTMKPQRGNEKPRVFRLPDDAAVINRLGFNSLGMDAVIKNLENQEKISPSSPMILGINIGKNKESADPIFDYVALLEHFYPLADYMTVNISSPNTPGLRDLQDPKTLSELLLALHQKKHLLSERFMRQVPLFIKLAPDLDDKALEGIAATISDHVPDGVIIGNTTVGLRDTLLSKERNQKGGLSGRPLFGLSTERLHTFYQLTHGKVPLIGVGGIFSAKDAYQKIKAGASLVQLYTGLIYEGPCLVQKILQELPELLAADGFKHISEAVGKLGK